MVVILMMSQKSATLSLLRIKVFWNKGFEVIISVHDITNEVLSRDSIYIIDVIMGLKFDNSSISMRAVIITSIKSNFVWGLVLVQVQ